MELNVDSLGTVWDAVFDVQAKCYNLGVVLKVPVGKLDGIVGQYSNPSDQLREILKEWLKTSTQRTWQTLVNALKSRIVSEPTLASDIEAEYCQGTPGQARGQTMPRDTQIEALQQQVMALQQHVESKTQPQQTVERLEKKLREQQHAIEAGERKQRELTQQLQSVKQTVTQPRETGQLRQKPQEQKMRLRKLIWRDGPKAPEAMYRGSVAIDGTMVYCNGYGSARVHQYHSEIQQWRTLPDLPHVQSTLVMADRKVTSVGGYLRGQATDSLLSLRFGDRKWSQHFPPMISKRHATAAICHGRSLIVAGGMDGGLNTLATIEVLNMDTQHWSIASSLPHPLSDTTISICGERLYLLGGWDSPGHPTCSVLTCSISELLYSCQTPSQPTIWRCVTDALYKLSSGATLCGQLVVVGGGDEDDKDTTAVSTYDETTNSWLPMEAMKTPRYRPLVASLHDNTLLIIGGVRLDTVEIAKVS